MRRFPRFPFYLVILTIAGTPSLPAQRQMENLTRGLVAVKQPDGGVYISWRLFGTDPANIEFDLYRRTADDTPVRVNPTPIRTTTQFTDRKSDLTLPLEYFVLPRAGGHQFPSSNPVRAWESNHLDIPIQTIAGYRPGDASLGDLDGDGQYEIILHQVSQGRDNSFAGITGQPILDAYKLDGTLLWRIDLGINIREGEHYTQFMVYDLDGDGRAEVACKTADGTRDGKGKIIGDGTKDWRNKEAGTQRHGRILEGPEFFTIFDGMTGAELKTVDYVPNRYPIDGWGGIGGNGGNDNYGNRCDRFLACIAYLDGVRPSVIMCRGVYGRIVLAAWDWRGGNLAQRWVFDSGISYPPFTNASPFSGMGGHALSVADVDFDGRDEIVYQAMTVDDNGKGLYSTGRRHGDVLHIGDFNPDRPGLELFLVTENEDSTVRFQTPGVGLHDAGSGKPLWTHSPGVDVSDGMVADIDPRHRGAEVWNNPNGLRTIGGKLIGRSPRSTDWSLWWDGDVLRELLSGGVVTKWNWKNATEERLLAGPRGGARIVADLLGDWREEILVTAPGGNALRLYTTTIPTEHRIHTLMHDPQYRLSIAWQNVVYNKPPHTSFHLGDGMSAPPRPHIQLIGNGEALKSAMDRNE